jgi:3-oxoacyl-[acyl-carrier protein] reductase
MGKTVLITGGSKGIGSACCKKFAQENYNVIFTYKSSKQAAEELCNDLKQYGNNILAVQLDISDKNSCTKVLTDIVSKNQIDVLINNAGIAKDNLLFWSEPEDWEEVIHTNLNGIFYVTSIIVKSMVMKRSGSIVNLSSVSALSGNIGQTSYSATKAGIIGFTKSLSLELARQSIRVNCVAPGIIETEMTSNLSENLKKLIPMKRPGLPEEVAEAVYFLASDKASYITGEVINISGGLWR